MEAGARSADLGPGAVGIAAGSAAHGLRSTVDVDAMNEIAAAGGPAIVEVLDNHLAVAPVARIAPAHWLARGPALPGIELGLARELAITRIERAADLVADDAADHCAGERRRHLATALAELVADDAAGDGADGGAGVLVIGTACRNEGHAQRRCQRTTSHDQPSVLRPPTAGRVPASARRRPRQAA